MTKSDNPTFQPSITIALIGDSTVADYAIDDSLRGWGQLLSRFLKPEVRTVNLAINGKSTKTFRETSNWEKTLELRPDLVLIQFGHNDSHPAPAPEGTEPNGDYTEYLITYILEARAAGIAPVLVTPMHRRTFDVQGKVTQELAPYAEAMKDVAKRYAVPIIDLHTLSGELYEQLGELGSAFLMADNDRTHFTEAGALEMAKLVAREIPSVDDRLIKALL